jgi:hypothetical protein
MVSRELPELPMHRIISKTCLRGFDTGIPPTCIGVRNQYTKEENMLFGMFSFLWNENERGMRNG